MVRAIKQRVTVGAGGRVQIDHSELPEGRTAEVIVLLDDSEAAASPPAEGVPRPAGSYFGACRGQFKSVEEADAYLRGLRDEWERP